MSPSNLSRLCVGQRRIKPKVRTLVRVGANRASRAGAGARRQATMSTSRQPLIIRKWNLERILGWNLLFAMNAHVLAGADFSNAAASAVLLFIVLPLQLVAAHIVYFPDLGKVGVFGYKAVAFTRVAVRFLGATGRRAAAERLEHVAAGDTQPRATPGFGPCAFVVAALGPHLVMAEISAIHLGLLPIARPLLHIVFSLLVATFGVAESARWTRSIA